TSNAATGTARGLDPFAFRRDTARVARYADSLTLLEARRQYFDANGFGEGGYDAKWVSVKIGPVPFAFPNTPQRVRSVRLHDLHHVVTDYDTDMTGEAEIGAWEIASNCRDHWAAWLLNLFALGMGLFISPARMWRAFVRGRRSRISTNESSMKRCSAAPCVTFAASCVSIRIPKALREAMLRCFCCGRRLRLERWVSQRRSS